ncbi:MAG: hypothetical protein IH611_03240 [Deltaproteobacteria bacterium]|nr:hypothetical protein [Deltaproteobacteria bacterium]
MKKGTGFIAGVLAAAFLLAAAGAFAAQEYVLAGGTRAVIEGHRLILIGENSERAVAPAGVYQIRESGQAIYVTAERVEVRTRPPEIR